MTVKVAKVMQIIGVLILACLVGQILSDCNVCQTNRAACINSTSYYMCFGDNTPYTDYLYHCLDGFQCSDLDAICVQKSAQRPPSCGDTSKCGQCSAQRNYLFACQSRGYFQMCYGASQPTGAYGKCPTGMVCDASSSSVCVQETSGQTVTCDVDDDLVSTTSTTTSTTTEASTTPNSTEASTTPNSTVSTTPTPSSNATEICQEKAKSGLYETSPRDAYCKRYIDCYYKIGTIQAREYDCPNSSYFDADSQSCVYIKPSNCT